jgi:hypothetical protein
VDHLLSAAGGQLIEAAQLKLAQQPLLRSSCLKEQTADRLALVPRAQLTGGSCMIIRRREIVLPATAHRPRSAPADDWRGWVLSITL